MVGILLNLLFNVKNIHYVSNVTIPSRLFNFEHPFILLYYPLVPELRVTGVSLRHI